jgi:hypothetical protein
MTVGDRIWMGLMAAQIPQTHINAMTPFPPMWSGWAESMLSRFLLLGNNICNHDIYPYLGVPEQCHGSFLLTHSIHFQLIDSHVEQLSTQISWLMMSILMSHNTVMSCEHDSDLI